jgi:uridylate kinase
VELNTDVFLKGTRVDGVYSADPEKDKNAVRYRICNIRRSDRQTPQSNGHTAFTMCRENRMPVVVFDMNSEGSLEAVVRGEGEELSCTSEAIICIFIYFTIFATLLS